MIFDQLLQMPLDRERQGNPANEFGQKCAPSYTNLFKLGRLIESFQLKKLYLTGMTACDLIYAAGVFTSQPENVVRAVVKPAYLSSTFFFS